MQRLKVEIAFLPLEEPKLLSGTPAQWWNPLKALAKQRETYSEIFLSLLLLDSEQAVMIILWPSRERDLETIQGIAHRIPMICHAPCHGRTSLA